MPKSQKPHGVRQPPVVLTNEGNWVGSKYSDFRMGKNSHIHDFFGRKHQTHTSPLKKRG